MSELEESIAAPYLADIEALRARCANQNKLIGQLSGDRRERIATACLAGLLANGEVVKACFINRGSVIEMIDDLTVKAIHAADGLIYCLGTPTQEQE